MKKKVMNILIISIIVGILLMGCNGESSDSNEEVTVDDTSTEEIGNDDAEETIKTYESSFQATGDEADVYTNNLDEFEEEFIQYFEGTNELDKVKGYNEPIEINTTLWYNAADEEGAGKLNQKYGESLTEHRWTDAMKRMFNIDVKYSWQTQDADYNQKLRLDMTSGELPDIFLVRTQNDLAQLAEQGLIWDLTDFIDQYASEYDKESWKSDEGGSIQKATIDDKIYGLPSMQSATDSVSYIWIRDDWMQKLNLEYPETLDELADIMEAFVTQDPDENGIDDTWGVLMSNDIIDPLRGIYGAFGSYPGDWYDKEGKLVFGATDENTRRALEYISELYENGYINPEFVAQDRAKANEAVLNDKVGIAFYGHWFGHTAGDLRELNPDATWKCIELPTVEGEPVKSILRPSQQGWVVVNKNFDYPEIAFKMRSLTSMALQSKNSAWWWYEENITWHLSPVRSNVSAFDNLDTYKNLQEAYNNDNDETLLTGKAVPYWANLHGADAWEWELMFGPGDGTAFAVLEKDYEAGNLFWNPYNGVQSSFMQERWSNIESERERFFTDIITGQKNVNEGFDEWINTYNNLGGEQIDQEVNAWYIENK